MKIIIFLIFVTSILLASTDSLLTNIEDNDGEKIFEETCASCHTGGFKGWMTGAPEIGDYDDWEIYFKDGLTEITKHIYNGTDRHEAKGDCDECSEEQIKAAIEYIISNTKNETDK